MRGTGIGQTASKSSKVEPSMGTCDAKGVNASRGDLDAHGPFFDIIGLALFLLYYRELFAEVVDILYCHHDHDNDIVRVAIKLYPPVTRQSNPVPVVVSPYYLRQYQYSSHYRISQMSLWNNVACNLPIAHNHKINQTNYQEFVRYRYM